jgi:hypothetical protein
MADRQMFKRSLAKFFLCWVGIILFILVCYLIDTYLWHQDFILTFVLPTGILAGVAMMIYYGLRTAHYFGNAIIASLPWNRSPSQ